MRLHVTMIAVALAAATAGCGDGKDDQSATAAKVPAGCEAAAPKTALDAPSELPRPKGALRGPQKKREWGRDRRP